MQLAIVLTSKYRLLSLAAIADVFETANRLLRETGKPDSYQITFVGSTETKVLPEGINHIPYTPLSNGRWYDLIFVPAFGPVDLGQTVVQNSCFFPWLHEQHARGAILASNCTGAFLLGASGLLNGKRATTHIDAADTLAACFPEIKL